jgi:DNA-binding LacI/PurR family transcriptional regulator
MVILGGAQMVGLEAEGGEAEMKKMLSRKERPTAVVCMSDTIAAGASRALLAAGVVVGGEVSVTGLGDGVLARYGVVPLTTVRFPSLGRIGFSLWQKVREGTGEMKPEIVEGELVVRESSGKA